MWDEGYGAGLAGCDWVAAVDGRFLRPWERADLARGWRAGLAVLDALEADQKRRDEFEAAVSWERAGPAWDELPL